jgi:hypothetical protein
MAPCSCHVRERGINYRIGDAGSSSSLNTQPSEPFVIYSINYSTGYIVAFYPFSLAEAGISKNYFETNLACREVEMRFCLWLPCSNIEQVGLT